MPFQAEFCLIKLGHFTALLFLDYLGISTIKWLRRLSESTLSELEGRPFQIIVTTAREKIAAYELATSLRIFTNTQPAIFLSGFWNSTTRINSRFSATAMALMTQA